MGQSLGGGGATGAEEAIREELLKRGEGDGCDGPARVLRLDHLWDEEEGRREG